MLYRRDALTGLMTQMALSPSQNVFSALQDVLEGTSLFAGIVYGQMTQKKVGKRAMALKSSKVWWNSKTNQLARSFAWWTQISSANMATSLLVRELVAYPVLDV